MSNVVVVVGAGGVRSARGVGRMQHQSAQPLEQLHRRIDLLPTNGDTLDVDADRELLLAGEHHDLRADRLAQVDRATENDILPGQRLGDPLVGCPVIDVSRHREVGDGVADVDGKKRWVGVARPSPMSCPHRIQAIHAPEVPNLQLRATRIDIRAQSPDPALYTATRAARRRASAQKGGETKPGTVHLR